MIDRPRSTSRSPDLHEAQDRFVAVWGQMAGAWGISRTMAEVHALLYITGEAMCTDDVMERLQISRGNASMSVRALLDWGIVSRETRRGDRKEYFRAEQDVWALFRAIVRERMNREVDPLLASLYEIRDMARNGREDGVAAPERGASPDPAGDLARRVDAMVEFFETLEKFGQRFVSPSGRGLQLAASILAKLPDIRGAESRGERQRATGTDAEGAP